MDPKATYVAPMTCTVVDDEVLNPGTKKSSIPLSNFAEVAAYVLIAEPGAGKTTTFVTEAARNGGVFVTIRNFRTFEDRPEWHNSTLFLDGLDESRVGLVDGRAPLDDILNKLNRLGCPPFRLSCRWADWMATNDKDRLREVSPDGTVIVLRLEPLSERNVKNILVKRHSVADPERFIEAARQRGVDKLLRNPQNLEMLAKSVLEGNWPDSRKEMFDQACRMLIREPNGEHRAGNSSISDPSRLIEMAGRLCSVQLLSGTAGFTLPDRTDPDCDYPSFMEVDGEEGGRTARIVLGARLFTGTAVGKLEPTHRQVAEFLAARYVSGLLDRGLPLARILALITGYDAELLPSFGNFASWLAVHNKRSRKRLSQLIPSGMIYASDKQTYSTDEKLDLVQNLRRESYWNPWCTRSLSKVRGIGGIVSPELEETFREIFLENDRTHEHQSYVMLLMQMLADGDPLPELSDLLEKTVQDPTWNQGVRCAALDVLIAYQTHCCLGIEVLTRMADEIDIGSLDDPHDDLLGILLKALYPEVLSINEVQRYLKKPKLAVVSGEYVSFWKRHVPNESTPEQLACLLDGISAGFDDYRSFLVDELGRNSGLGQWPLDMLMQVLREARARKSEVHVTVNRLYEWLGVVSDPCFLVPDHKKTSLRFDLQWDSDTLKGLISHGIDACVREGDECYDLVDRRLFGARPRDYGRWCLQMALTVKEGKAVTFYLRELINHVKAEASTDKLTLEGARLELAANEELAIQFDEMVENRVYIETSTEDWIEPVCEFKESIGDTSEQKALQPQIIAQAQVLRDGRGLPQLLLTAAEAYLGIHVEIVGMTPHQRLRELVGGREDLIKVLLTGLERTIVREDLPDCDDVVRLFDQNQVNRLLLPFTAGLHSREQSGCLSASDLNESQTRLAVTVLYTFPREYVDPDSHSRTGVYRPAWYRNLLRDNPALVADVLRRSATLKIETGVQNVTELCEFAEAEDHREVAQIASLSILESFPKAETEVVLMALCWSLKAALKSCEWSSIDSLIKKRFGRSSLTAAEKGCWLMAGYLVAPRQFRNELKGLVEDADGLLWLARFVAAGSFPKDFTRRFAAEDFVPLVAVLGVALKTHGLPEKAYWATADVIAALAGDASNEATEILEALHAMPDAVHWSPAITDIKQRQARIRRESEYQYIDIDQVVQTLDNRSPANAADLAALVLDELQEISLRIRDGSTSDWRQHWNTDHHKNPTDPKHEDLSRDAVLSDLRERLVQLGIDAQPEGHYADGKRSDIRVSFDGFNVPVEIKRSCHDDLWTAVHNQLIPQYTRDPGAAGYGIYLVFWFGDTEKCRPTKNSGWTPEAAQEVESKILDSLDCRERHLITVCVVDVSKPQ